MRMRNTERSGFSKKIPNFVPFWFLSDLGSGTTLGKSPIRQTAQSSVFFLGEVFFFVAMAVSSVTCVYWEWQRDDGGFSPYVPNVSNAIEAANHAGMGGHNSGSYTVDFVRMIQRKNATGMFKKSHYVVLNICSICD